MKRPEAIMAKTLVTDEGKVILGEPEKKTVTDALFDRSLRGGRLFLGLLILSTVVFLGWFQLRVGIWGAYEGQIQRPVHLLLFMFLIFLYPLFREKAIGFSGVIKNILPAIFCIVILYYYMGNYQEMILRMGIAEPVDYFYGIVLILLVLEATRRTAGNAIVIVASVFILYSFFGNYFPGQLFHRGFSLSRIIGLHLTTTDGLFSIPLEVSSTFLILFMLFGSALSNSGAVDYFLDIANALVGKYNAGPAKLAVIASAFEGTYSGSAVSNVVGSGSVTIPLMKKLGYDPAFAAAVEASASTGGQIMPPVMGAGAFVMAGILGIPYFAVAKAAVIPAILYFGAVYVMVDLEGRKIGLSPLKEVPRLKTVLLKGGHLLIPLILLVYMLIAGFSLMRAGFILFASTILLSFLKKDTIVTPRKFLNILECGFRDASSVVMICGTAGLIIGSIMVTGVGLKLSRLILAMAAGHLWIALIFTMIVALILGMGMPTVAVYIVLSTLLGPGLKLLGTSLLAAHLFMFWFAVIAALTPPVAVAAYAGAAIAQSDPWKTGWIAFRFALSGFIVPYCFIYGPALIMQGTWPEIIQAFITASLGIFSLSVAVEGWFLVPIKNWLERGALFVAALLLIKPGLVSDIIGLVILAVEVGWLISRAGKWETLFSKGRIILGFKGGKG
jgi:TRAP transporter 4TM/12TM fusion protein